MKSTKISTTTAVLVMSLGLQAQDKTKLVNDGPYVFYENEIPSVKYVKDSKVEISNDLSKIVIGFTDHPEWNFYVRLKDKIEIEPTVYKVEDKIFVLSDIEGEFEAFRNILIANKVIDAKYNWIFGTGHLVINGDLFDRGSNVSEFLWLLYKLEQDAKVNGGYVHTILGNHDIMNLSGDLRYVTPKYMESAKLMGIEYMKFYDEDTELGRWLRSKNIVEKIGDLLFMHAGMSPEVYNLQIPLEKINNLCRPYYAAKRAAIPDDVKVFFEKNSPFWYRGYFMEPKATMTDVDNVLKLYNCSRIVVGHTILAKNIALYYSGKVLAIDVDEHAGKSAAALVKGGKWFILDNTGKQSPLKYDPENEIIEDGDIQ